MPVRRLSKESREAAQEYFDSWVLGGAAILESFTARIAAAGGPVDALDFTPQSLPVVFPWVVDHLSFVPGEVPDVPLPLWYLPGAGGGAAAFDPESAWLVDGLCRYYGEVLVRHLPGVRWSVADEPRQRTTYLDQNWPVVEGPLLKVNPFYAARLALQQSRLPAPERAGDQLLENFGNYLGIVRREAGEVPATGWGVDEVDVPALREAGWVAEVGLDEDLAAGHPAALDRLTAKLRSLPGVTDVDHQDRGSWLVGGPARREDLEAAVRGWLAERN
ncbi:hypothetical protein CLV92_102345 [Kineococcus xinjiangensis]|uniref:Uncharacterized protein n=1 Tax=Kineococcus xinjiangensis TaxID=512762 RepID=A0A2S6IV87_9ACTN|nr:hypothetical protein [Kineococcus xinjiangensis]PPK98192.1 hypothetical protein CLV92_102345 [Kineococcus xinjiangensis]